MTPTEQATALDRALNMINHAKFYIGLGEHASAAALSAEAGKKCDSVAQFNFDRSQPDTAVAADVPKPA
jgi:hypothetical protein